MVLHGRPCGRVGRCRIFFDPLELTLQGVFLLRANRSLSIGLPVPSSVWLVTARFTSSPQLGALTENSLLDRARAVAGQTLGQLAWRFGMQSHAEPRRTKGFAGQLLERALGAQASSQAGPDFAGLGIELKTLPLSRSGRPSESTFVATLNSAEPGALRWVTSPVRAKLARVLWMPIDGDPVIPWERRRIGAPILWSPSGAEEATLRDDFELISELVSEGFRDRVSARLGRVLQLRPKGRDGRDLRWSLDDEGAPVRVAGRAFYLRARFTATIVRGALAP